ncbi:hypothetical protein ACFYNX_31060 [Streptomyces sp. NPDC007872]|uniref:hypothetical protein n=1 Tax=Streptomyces sp. NPDC007872 TaxID=3364782 RepID=UPI0036859895
MAKQASKSFKIRWRLGGRAGVSAVSYSASALERYTQLKREALGEGAEVESYEVRLGEQ